MPAQRDHFASLVDEMDRTSLQVPQAPSFKWNEYRGLLEDTFVPILQLYPVDSLLGVFQVAIRCLQADVPEVVHLRVLVKYLRAYGDNNTSMIHGGSV